MEQKELLIVLPILREKLTGIQTGWDEASKVEHETLSKVIQQLESQVIPKKRCKVTVVQVVYGVIEVEAYDYKDAREQASYMRDHIKWDDIDLENFDFDEIEGIK